MDTTPDSTKTRAALDVLPGVRTQWSLPAQRLWAQRIWGILRGNNPNLVQVVDGAVSQAQRNIEAELGIPQNNQDIHLTRDEWEQALLGVAHVAGAVTAYALAEATSEVQSLEANLAQRPEST